MAKVEQVKHFKIDFLTDVELCVLYECVRNIDQIDYFFPSEAEKEARESLLETLSSIVKQIT